MKIAKAHLIQILELSLDQRNPKPISRLSFRAYDLVALKVERIVRKKKVITGVRLIAGVAESEPKELGVLDTEDALKFLIAGDVTGLNMLGIGVTNVR